MSFFIKKNYFIALFFSSLMLNIVFADDLEEIRFDSLKSPLFVSLGSHCEVAVKLRENKLRNAAFPFDWLLTLNHKGLISLLKDDFCFFLDERYFIQHPTNPNIIENCCYEIEFRYDPPSFGIRNDPDKYKKQLQEIRAKYKKRITRFRQIGLYSGKVLFIRAAYNFQNDPHPYWGEKSQSKIGCEQALELKNALEQFFPFLNFTLVIINYKEENVPPIKGFDKIIEFKIGKSHKFIDYLMMFRTLQKTYSYLP